LHRLTCPHTSQQNGIAERKHRHVMEMGLTLLAQSGLSPRYWVDAFLTSIYLINRLPSPVLQQESPFSKLFHHPPDYSTLRTFGCLCYPLLRPYATHKLSFRSKPCIFIGYGSNQKGYRCLDPTTPKCTCQGMSYSMRPNFLQRILPLHLVPARSQLPQVTH
jgi:hypothetical protein